MFYVWLFIFFFLLLPFDIPHNSLQRIKKIRSSLPGIRVVAVIHVQGEEALDAAREAAREADAILLDSGNPKI